MTTSLYLVKCILSENDEELVYTIASDFNDAETKALDTLKSLGYEGFDNAEQITLLASNDSLVSDMLLAV